MLYVLLIIAGLLSWFALKNKSFLIGFLAGAAWFVTMAYVATYPPGPLVQGDTIHGMLVLVLVGVALTIPLASMRLARSKKYEVDVDMESTSGRGRISGQVTSESVSMNRSARHGFGGQFAETPEEYQARVRAILRPRHKRR